MSRSRKRKPFYYVCCFDHKNQTWAKTQHNRVLRKIKRDLLQEIKTAKDIDSISISVYTGSHKKEGNDLWGFPSDGGHLYCGDWKYIDDEDYQKWYNDALRK